MGQVGLPATEGVGGGAPTGISGSVGCNSHGINWTWGRGIQCTGLV